MKEESFLLQQTVAFLDNIKFADQKASGVITLNTIVVGAMQTLKCYESTSVTIQALSLSGAISLSIAILFSIHTVWPRGNNKKSGHISIPGIIDPHRVNLNISDSEFKDLYSEALSNDMLKDQLIEMIYKLSKINKYKYASLNKSLKISFIGWFLSLSSTIMIYFNSFYSKIINI